MTEPTSQPIAPGWYPDHADPALQRWWDGTQWTEHTQQAYVAGGVDAAQLKAPEGTSWNTVWIWLVLLLPLLSTGLIFLVDFRGYFDAALTMDYQGMMGSLLTPGLVISQTVPWLIYGVCVFFAYLDWKELTKRGVPKPFHWAFGFLSFVYPIGRAVVTNRRGIGGLVVLWVAIAAIVISFVVTTVWTVALFNGVMQSVLTTVPSR